MIMKCPNCGNEEFNAHQQCYHDVVVDGNNNFIDNKGIYESNQPYGPYTCTKCGEEVEELEDHDN